MAWDNKQQPFGVNRAPLLTGLASDGSGTNVPIAVDPITGAVLTETTSGSGTDNVNIVSVGGNAVTTTLPVVDSAGDASLVTIATNTTGLATSANQTNATQQTKLTDGNNIANVVAGDTGFNGVATNAGTKTISFTTSSSGAQIFGPYNVEGYMSLDVQFTSVGSGLTLTGGQFCNTVGGTYVNSTNFVNNAQAVGQAVGGLGGTLNNVYRTNITGNYFQINVSALTSGTVSGFVILRSSPVPLSTNFVNQLGTWTVGSNSATGSAVPANAFYPGINNFSGNLQGLISAGRFGNNTVNADNALPIVGYAVEGTGTTVSMIRTANAAAATTGTGLLGVGNLVYDGANWQAAKSGGVTGIPGVSIQASPTGAFTYGHISTAATTTLKSGAGTLHNVSVNTLGTVASTATIYDNTAGSGTVIGVINTLNLSGSFILDVAFTTGLTIVTTGTIAPDLTVSFK